MSIKKIAVITIIALLIIGLATAMIINIKPGMHKTIMLENIIFIRSK